MSLTWKVTRYSAWAFAVSSAHFIGRLTGEQHVWIAFALVAFTVTYAIGMVYMANIAIERGQAPSSWASAYLACYWSTFVLFIVSIALHLMGLSRPE